MSNFDFNDTEACHLSEIYDDYEGYHDYQEYIAEQEYQRANTLATLAGLDDDYYTRQRERRKRRKKQKKGNKDLFIVIQDSRKDNTTLMLVDRRKSKEYWWTHDMSIAYKGLKEDMRKVVSRLKKNNVRVVSYNDYLKNA